VKALVCSALASTLLLGCVTSDDEEAAAAPRVGEVSQGVTSDAASLVAATNAFTAQVASSVHDSAAAVGVALPASAVKTGYAARNTLGAGAASGAQLVLVAKTFVAGRATFAPGLYQLVPTSRGPTLFYFGPTGRVDLGLARAHDPTQQSDDDGLCAGAPSLIMDFCLDFVACALHDEGCPALPGYTYVG
jgi:hypothetical protein